MERHAFYIILLSIIGILWYMSLWGIFEEFVDFIHKKYKIHRRYLYMGVVSVILVTILIHPQILEII